MSPIGIITGGTRRLIAGAMAAALVLGLGSAAWPQETTAPASGGGFGFDSDDSDPIEISADNGIEWKRDSRTYTARGILPAMGYGDEQIRDLEATIRATPADVVVEGTPIELARVLRSDKPIVNVAYELVEREPGALESALRRAVG